MRLYFMPPISTPEPAPVGCFEFRIRGCSTAFSKLSQCPPVTVYPARRKSSAKSTSIRAAASNGIGFRCV